jgi:glyoxylase-like metal-dependent hydrolase (beta-lactamase superfamily II)
MLISGHGSVFQRARLLCHCLLVESDAGLILIDTGLGVQDVQFPQTHLTPQFRFLAQPQLRLEETALYQIEQRGFSRSDVQHIILTHLDFDHAGGLSDFPQAKVHLLDDEYQSAITQVQKSDWTQQFQHRYRYRSMQWHHQPEWVRYQAEGEAWFGFECVRSLEGLPPEILLVPLRGHTAGHTGIAVQTPKGWLLHVGDAYYHRDEMTEVPRCPLGLAIVQRLGDMNSSIRRRNQERLRQLKQAQGETMHIFCAHDPVEWEQCRELQPFLN